MKEVWEKISKMQVDGLDDIDDDKPFEMFEDAQKIEMRPVEEVKKHTDLVYKNVQTAMAKELQEATAVIEKVGDITIDLETVKIPDDFIDKFFEEDEKIANEIELPRKTRLTLQSKKMFTNNVDTPATEQPLADPVEQN